MGLLKEGVSVRTRSGVTNVPLKECMQTLISNGIIALDYLLTPPNKRGWYYINLSKEIKGPVSAFKMRQWYLEQRKLSSHQLVCYGSGRRFMTIQQYFPNPLESCFPRMSST